MAAQHILFRTDASLQIGTGHVMRCLTLANALRERGADCVFICREHEGHLGAHIQKAGHRLHLLPRPVDDWLTSDRAPVHAGWLGADWCQDAEQSLAAMAGMQADWLVVDHYALDARWESRLRSAARRIMVIDDLADRPHDCDLLLDQNLGRSSEAYAPLVPAGCELLTGPRYALLRPEFAALREQSLARRANPRLQRLLVTMGGVDKDNATGKVLDALRECLLPEDCRITVVMGPHAPWLRQVREQALRMPRATEVLVDAGDMAQLMSECDLAIGAAGSTAWERCALGLPALVQVLASNQRSIAEALAGVHAAIRVDVFSNTDSVITVIGMLGKDLGQLAAMSMAAAHTCTGKGAKVIAELLQQGVDA